MSNKLFYSSKYKRLFWIAGYTLDENTSFAIKKAAYLVDYTKQFAKLVNCDPDKVCTVYVTDSQRYNYMRVFWIDDVENTV